MKWLRVLGAGHAVVAVEGDTWTTACGIAVDLPDEAVEVKDFFPRPYGVDTHPECHAIVKGWATSPETAPEGLNPAPEELASNRRLTAEERAAVIAGSSLTPVPHNGPDTAPAAPPARTGQKNTVPEPGSDEDMGWPDEPSTALPTVDGAVVVSPARRSSRRHRSTVVSDEPDEIDKD